eukprot:gene28989-34988_t
MDKAMMFLALITCVLAIQIVVVCTFVEISPKKLGGIPRSTLGKLHGQSNDRQTEEYRNPVVSLLSNLLPAKNTNESSNYLSKVVNFEEIDWGVKKRRKTSLAALSKDLEVSLSVREWFVTGLVDPSFFSDDFSFVDPDVKIKGIQEYAKGVRRLFDQKTSQIKADIRKTKEKLKKAEEDGKGEAYLTNIQNTLAKQQETLNLLLAQSAPTPVKRKKIRGSSTLDQELSSILDLLFHSAFAPSLSTYSSRNCSTPALGHAGSPTRYSYPSTSTPKYASMPSVLSSSAISHKFYLCKGPIFGLVNRRADYCGTRFASTPDTLSANKPLQEPLGSSNGRFWIRNYDFKVGDEGDLTGALVISKVEAAIKDNVLSLPKADTAVIIVPEYQLFIPMHNGIITPYIQGEANVNVTLEWSTLDIWSDLAENMEWVVRPYNSVKAINIKVVYRRDWCSDFLDKLAYLGPLISARCTSPVSRAGYSQLLPLRLLQNEKYHSNRYLSTASLARGYELPGALLDAIVQHCPNIPNLLPNTSFAEDVDMDRYLEACVRCKHLEVLVLASDWEYVPDDSLTFQAAAACLTHCPLMENINLKGLLLCTIDRSAAGGARLSLQLMCKGAKVRKSTARPFETCLARMPGLYELAVAFMFSASEMDQPASLLVRTRRSEQLAQVTLVLIDFADISPIFRALPNLATLSLKARDAYESSCFGTAFDRCVRQIALHCTKLRSLTLHMPKMTDVDFLTLTLKVPSLTTLKVTNLQAHATGLVTAIREDGVRVKELRLSHDSGHHFRFGPTTAEDVGHKLL